VQEHAEAAIAICEEQGFLFWLTVGIFWRGWALSAQGHKEEGVAHMRQGIPPREVLMAPYMRALLARTCAPIGHREEGWAIIETALNEVEHGEGRFYTAERHRLKGELLLHAECEVRSMALTPEVCFRQALDLARRAEAKWWELRAATSLARLWQSQGKRQEAYDLLAPVYAWFTEGFDTADMQAAKALLTALG
jgi:predicted ATPase